MSHPLKLWQWQAEYRTERLAIQKAMEQREAKQVVHSANTRNVSAECQRNTSRDPDRKLGQGGLPSLGKRR